MSVGAAYSLEGRSVPTVNPAPIRRIAMKIEDTRRPLSVAQLAERWGCSQGLVRKLIREGRLQCFRPGQLIRIKAAEVERYELHGPLPAEPPSSAG
jgi:excisionase family DNA binding protein